MIKKTPNFWYKPFGWKALLLMPFSAIFRILYSLHWLWYTHFWNRFFAYKQPKIPVICVGNLIVGGAGKTPVVRALKHLLSSYNVHFLTRGYKGKEPGPLAINKSHTVTDVGDEALLLSQDAPTWVAQQRYKGIDKAYSAGAQVTIMDDGPQNLTVKKTVQLMVIDEQMGFGNGCLLPAGPLREPLKQGLNHIDACIIITHNESFVFEKFQPLLKTTPTFLATTKIENITHIPKTPLIAFAGIGYPKKFFSLLERTGFTVIKTVAFADHYSYSEKDLKSLYQQAFDEKACLVTTEKDYVRLPLSYRKDIIPVKIHLEIHNSSALKQFIDQFL